MLPRMPCPLAHGPADPWISKQLCSRPILHACPMGVPPGKKGAQQETSLQPPALLYSPLQPSHQEPMVLFAAGAVQAEEVSLPFLYNTLVLPDTPSTKSSTKPPPKSWGEELEVSVTRDSIGRSVTKEGHMTLAMQLERQDGWIHTH